MNNTKQVSGFRRIEHASGYSVITKKEMERAESGAYLVYRGHVGIMSEFFGYVQSQTNNNVIYHVTDTRCECPFHQQTKAICKHMFAFRFAKQQQQKN